MKKIKRVVPLLLLLIGICMDVNAWPDNLFDDFAMEENQQDKQAFSFNNIY
ncbi:MAG TPA: hypothetical protein PKV22_01955 [Paludibacteraceae bacterium]|nr:hypothetical protein [Paludibacteraceae bacterium]HQK71984.1 hypothetical protein [Bacteroidales bacterium]